METTEAPTVEQLQARVRVLEDELALYTQPGALVPQLAAELRKSWTPVATWDDSTEQLTTEELMRRFRAMLSSTTEEDMVAALRAQGYTTGSVGGRFFWLFGTA